MKKLCTALLTILCLELFGAAPARAQGAASGPSLGLGFDMANDQFLINLQATRYLRIEGGLAMDWDNREGTEDEFDMNATIALQLATHAYRNLTGYLVLAGMFDDIGREDVRDAFTDRNRGDVATRVLLAYEPELLLFDHLALSTQFGFRFLVFPDFRTQTYGPGTFGTNGEDNLFSDLKIKFMF